MPNTASVRGAPICFATPPATNDPIGCTPMNIIAYTAITRLRSSSGTRFCTVVFVAAIIEVAENPTTKSTPAENQKTVEYENRIKQTEEMIAIPAIHLANPLKCFRVANCNAPSAAPTPA